MAHLVTSIAHVGIRVHDLERAEVFYALLGFEHVIGPVGTEPVAIIRHPAGVEINLVLNAPEATTPNVLMDVPGKKPGITHLALRVTDLEAAQVLLEGAGVVVTEGPIGFPDGGRAFFVRDPDGNVIELNWAPTAG